MRFTSPDAATALVDVHGHYLGADTGEGADSGPRLLVDRHGRGHLVSGVARREVPAALWDVGLRLAELDRSGVTHQVISPLPAAMQHAWQADPTYARRVNDSIASACAASGGRLIGLGCLPAGDVIAELARCLSMGLRGIEVGTTMGGSDLDDPELATLWAQCAASGASVFVHPVAHGRGVLRRSDPQLDAGLAMLTDTAISAHALVFGGVLDAHPDLRIALAHGAGTFPWAYPRLRRVRSDARPPEEWDALAGHLYADSLVLDVEHLRLLTHRLGSDRLLLGSDAPFLPDQTASLRQLVDDAVASGAVAEHARDDLLFGNALTFLGLRPAP